MVTITKTDWEYGKVLKLPEYKKKDRVVAIIQARTTSVRFPEKIYEDLNGCPILYHVIGRANECRMVDSVIVASPHPLDDLPDNTPNYVFEGDENDVLSRYFWCSQENKSDYYVRLTSDCPLLNPSLIDFIVSHALITSADYCSNVLKLTFPDGADAEVINHRTLAWLNQSVKSPYHREHVTSIIRDNLDIQNELNCVSIENSVDLSNIKYSIDTKEDLERVRIIEAQKYL